MAAEIQCPMCSGCRPALADLDLMLIDLMNERGLSEDAQSVLEAVYDAGGKPITADRIFDRMFDHDPDGGPAFALAYKFLREALAELAIKLEGTGIGIENVGRRDGWALRLLAGGAYVAA